MSSSYFLESLLKVSEKAANIARVCRQNQHLFKLLVQEKKNEERNPRFLQDFKTLADVLIQETVKHDIGNQFSDIAGYIYGEETNSFTNTLGDTITVEVQKDQDSTAALLSKWPRDAPRETLYLASATHHRTSVVADARHAEVLDGDTIAANLLASEVHRDMVLAEVDAGSVPLPLNLELPLQSMAMWVDPIDSTAEYISGEEIKSPVADIFQSGLRCVTVLIGVFDRNTGTPVIGVINQPFYRQDANMWHGRCLWGVSYNGVNYCSLVPDQCDDIKKVVVLSRFENSALVSSLNCAGYSLAEAAGAGYKLLCVADGCADAFVLLKSSTYFWDTCGPHALLRSMGGGILDCKSITCMEGSELNKEISYTCGDQKDKSLGMSAFSNKGGFVASRDKQTLDKLVTLIAGLERIGNKKRYISRSSWKKVSSLNQSRCGYVLCVRCAVPLIDVHKGLANEHLIPGVCVCVLGDVMATSLTGVGVLWAFLSLAAALLCCSGFYLPFWIQVSCDRASCLPLKGQLSCSPLPRATRELRSVLLT
uniref:Inositol polyphosphate 1-phosphatase n=1 Tax=Timema monikensis TaxID=170555 RepID=A0A7R9HJV7_9NEOP|nr:unnamed protein product [Timema monikensis]